VAVRMGDTSDGQSVHDRPGNGAAASPARPGYRTETSTTGIGGFQDASAASSRAMFASAPQGLMGVEPMHTLLKRIKLAASTLMYALAIGNCTP